MKAKIVRLLTSWVALLAAANSTPVMACAVCFGKSDSALAKGLHWGVISLLAVVLCVLGAIASFFIYLAKRSAATPDVPPTASSAFSKDLSC